MTLNRTQLATKIAEHFLHVKEIGEQSSERAEQAIENFWRNISRDQPKLANVQPTLPKSLEEIRQKLTQKEMEHSGVFVDMLVLRLTESDITDEQMRKFVDTRFDTDFSKVMDFAETETRRIRTFATNYMQQ